MIDEPSRSPAVEAVRPTVDVGALARSLRPKPNSAVAVLWWVVFVLLVVACANPNPVTISFVWVYIAVLMWKRGERHRKFRRNLATLPCFSRSATPAVAPDAWPGITLLVPARNEEENIEEAARSVASLSYPNLDVWFINDHSTDRTPHILNAVKRDYPHVHVLHDPPVEEGWFGKSNALWQAVVRIEQAQPEPGDANAHWLLFADADVVFEGGVLEQAILLAERDQLDFLTCMPRLITQTWAEQLLLPTGWRGILQGADPDSLNDPESFPIGIGAFLLIRHSCYRAIGGHKALGAWHPEDTLMAAAVKHIGGRVGFAWTPDLLRVHFYHGYREVKKHTLRKTRIFFGDHLQLPLTMMALRLSTTLMALPMMIAGIAPQFFSGRFDLLLTLLAAAGLVLYVDETREYQGVEKIAEFHPLVPWLHPLSGVLRVWFAVSLICQMIANKPMDWRGREEFGTTNPSATKPNS